MVKSPHSAKLSSEEKKTVWDLCQDNNRIPKDRASKDA